MDLLTYLLTFTSLLLYMFLGLRIGAFMHFVSLMNTFIRTKATLKQYKIKSQ